MNFEAIKHPIQEEFKTYEKVFSNSVKSNVPLINYITRYILKTKGKQMRPLFVLLSAQLYGKVSDSSYRAASMIELLHTATLVHDDVVDDAVLRRGAFSVKALWQNKIAVLIGDYILSRGMLMAVEHKEYTALEIVSRATREMSEGELLQIEKARRPKVDESLYFEIIRKKTASLIASCFAAGAASNGASEEEIERMYKTGETVGIAFQIKDDIMDFEHSESSGKKAGNDIKEKKLSLPLIYYLNSLGYVERKKVLMDIRFRNKKSEKLHDIIKAVKESGGIEYAEEKMKEYLQKGLQEIERFEDSETKTSIIELINYVIYRSK